MVILVNHIFVPFDHLIRLILFVYRLSLFLKFIHDLSLYSGIFPNVTSHLHHFLLMVPVIQHFDLSFLLSQMPQNHTFIHCISYLCNVLVLLTLLSWDIMASLSKIYGFLLLTNSLLIIVLLKTFKDYFLVHFTRLLDWKHQCSRFQNFFFVIVLFLYLSQILVMLKYWMSWVCLLRFLWHLNRCTCSR